MKQVEANPMRWMAAVCGLGLALAAPRSLFAQQAAKTPDRAESSASAQPSSLDTFAPTSFSALLPGVAPSQAAAKPAVEEEEESPTVHKPGGNGIKVHGHWVLQVKNADGTLGERREFENSLVTDDTQPSGDQILTGLLTRNIVLSDPAVGLINFANAGLETNPASTWCAYDAFGSTAGISCYLFSTSQSLVNAYVTYGSFGGLETGLQTTANFTKPVGWVLSGVYTVPAGLTSIWAVQTLVAYCAPLGSSYVSGGLNGTVSDGHADISPTNCSTSGSLGGDGSSPGTLTSTVVPGGPMTVTPGQYLVISVAISFS